MSLADLVLEEVVSPEELSAVVSFLDRHNDLVDLRWAPEALSLTAGIRGVVVGGLSGATNWDWLYVKLLAVDPLHRGKGIGGQLLRRAESLACQRGCIGVHLDTFSFQALTFYQGCGYEVFGTLPAYPGKHSRYFLYKHLG
ncbi:MAG: GNAT family N-acetyltransferase [Candidatus Obscuribacterales bacterium]|nr:GNAT family N-acetyltransferase [Candidatus Obscuribacterales bacterium]